MTLIRRLNAVPTALSILTLGASIAAQDSSTAKIETLPDLIAAVEARENAVKTVQIDLRSRGQLPGGPQVETEGTLRVLGTTHFHSTMTTRIGEAGRSQTQFESETVTTPDGVTMRNDDPMQGEVFVRMSSDLLEELESASLALGETSVPVAGGESSGMANGPLGSVMLRDLDKVFALELSGPSEVDKQASWVVQGPRRDADELAKAEIDEEVLGGADRVELVVRRADLAVVRMTQFQAGEVMTEIRIERIVIDAPLEAASFAITVPRGVRVLDALDHPPHRAQIDSLFAEAEAAGWKRGAGDRADATSSKPTDGR